MNVNDTAHLDRLLEQGYLADLSFLRTRGTDTPRNSGDADFAKAADRMLARDPGARIVFLSSAPCTRAVAASGARLPVLLDDLAQLTGPAVPVARDFAKVRGALTKSAAVFVAGKGCLCRAADPYEAHALAMVVEKACVAFIGSSALGGGIPIPYREALLMRFIYKFKYGRKRR